MSVHVIRIREVDLRYRLVHVDNVKYFVVEYCL
jgi:hypothetical protein